MSIKIMNRLEPAYAEKIKRLENEVTSHDQISLKLEIDYKLAFMQEEIENNEFIYLDGQEVVGYIGILSFGDSAEISGMVHPDYRRRGIFKKLFEDVKKEIKQRKFEEVLLLADERSVAGKLCIEHLGGKYLNSEYEMSFVDHPLDNRSRLEFLKSAPEHHRAIETIDDACFGKSYATNYDSTYVAQHQGVIVGKVRLEMLNNVGGIFGLGVLPTYQKKGYGKSILESSVFELKKQGAEKVFLQVLTENENALGLYLDTGFKIDSRMDYYEWELI